MCAWSKEEREIPAEIAAALAATGVVKTIPVAPPQRWRIEADSRIGVLVGDGWELRIHPHIKIPRLLFLLTYSLRPEGWEGVVSGMSSELDLVQALAAGFAFHSQRVLDQGLLRGYVPIEERRGDLRGRVRFGDQLARLPGLPLPLEVAYDDFTADIPENRLLRSATDRLLLLPNVSPPARARLLRLRAALEEVSALPEHQRVELPPITQLNERYEAALVLGKLILNATSLRQEPGPVYARSFLFDMNEVFESFLFAALRESMRPFGGNVQRQAAGALDIAQKPGLPFRADIVWRKHGEVRAVIDSKYKSLAETVSTPNEDAYQMLAYCIGFGVRSGFLVYARDSLEHPRLYEVKQHGYQIDARSVGLEQEPEQVLAEVKLIATSVASTAREPVTLAYSLAGEGGG